MLFYTGLFFLVIAVSLDGFGVGIAYGMRRIRVPLIALFIIMLCSGVIVLTSMTIGSMITSYISAYTAKIIGGLILVSIGIFCLWNVIRSKTDDTVHPSENSVSQLNQFKSVLKEPQQADLDQSGVISIQEAILLGFALALDAFGAGLGAAMLGYSPLLTASLVAFMSGLMVFGGIHMGIFLSDSKWMKKMTLLPPFLLIALGIYNMI
ncbi:sporulation membrane protein YtaF [Virgibacillus dakarensis]|uniref:Sporulation membrane protein YtaF n=1 Tax=Lentibacillus populi TaxID=1827502 RepID=A0A9W5TWM7_9BACI|nr:sporulation membrane protein YtaF [Lentibacillus populi]MTW87445.1 sporulation membrane protein YtaF [Virgibacillus dakarensis]GGB37608.1 sporulation membrane protein YtaF [Lentibacillus populi]